MSSPSSTVKIAKIIPFKKNLRVREAVKKECNLGGKLSSFVQSYGYDNNVNVSTSLGKRKLLIDIVRVHGSGGGIWSGAKSVTVEGRLMEGNKEIGSFTGTRTSSGGFMGGYKGTCSILGRCVRTLGKDIGAWLANPSKNAIVGE